MRQPRDHRHRWAVIRLLAAALLALTASPPRVEASGVACATGAPIQRGASGAAYEIALSSGHHAILTPDGMDLFAQGAPASAAPLLRFTFDTPDGPLLLSPVANSVSETDGVCWPTLRFVHPTRGWELRVSSDGGALAWSWTPGRAPAWRHPFDYQHWQLTVRSSVESLVIDGEVWARTPGGIVATAIPSAIFTALDSPPPASLDPTPAPLMPTGWGLLPLA
jgi:hypothetical protein